MQLQQGICYRCSCCASCCCRCCRVWLAEGFPQGYTMVCAGDMLLGCSIFLQQCQWRVSQGAQ
jgi:hypothetical protein